MTRFLHITDLHITAPETDDPTQQTDTSATLSRLTAAAARLTPAPDFVVVSGDLTNIGDAASYRHLATLLADLRVPVVLALGNHDDRAAFRSVWTDAAGAADQPFDHDIVLAGHHVIALDSSVPGWVSGAFDAEQIDWLADRLAAHPDLPKLLAIHHPPCLDPARGNAWASLDPASTDRLAAAIAGHDVRAILSGHIHLNQLTVWNGVPLVVTMGQQSSIDPTCGDGLSVVEGTGFAICDLLPAGLRVTYAPLGELRQIKYIPAQRLAAYR